MNAVFQAFLYNPELELIDVSGNFVKEACASASRTIEHLEYLQDLNFADCSLGNKAGIRLVLALKRTSSCVRRLILNNNQLNSAQLGSDIAEMIHSKNELEVIGLRGNAFPKEVRVSLVEEGDGLSSPIFSDESAEESDGESIDLDDYFI